MPTLLFASVPDRIQNVSYIRKSHPIEANVFRLHMTKLPSFLRMDFSVNLYLAREEVVKFLNRYIGEVRDYNGGMMLKQGELLPNLNAFSRCFSTQSRSSWELLLFIESYWSSSNNIPSFNKPVLRDIYSSCWKGIPKRSFLPSRNERRWKHYHCRCSRNNPELLTLIEEALLDEIIQGRNFVSSSLTFEGSYYLSFLCSDPVKEKHEAFKAIVNKTLKKWQEDQSKLQILKIPYSDVVSLDPRIEGIKPPQFMLNCSLADL